ncbi:Polysaccharide deacetylase [uncultured archaeon]|nr:Polysaccharide deacetylase [uncultured archaeon]
MDKPGVPVIMYHSIGIQNNMWQWNNLICPYPIFENQLRWMQKKKFHTISLQHLYDYMKNGVRLPKNSIILTFDDSYLDNWVFAYPLLKKYGFQATIYVNPEFIDPRNIIRKNLDDVWKKDVKLDELETSGYLSWNELRKMETEGFVDIQSHTMSHTWYPINNNIIDFRNPDDSYIWMTWNENPTEKPFLQMDNKKIVRYGQPVYESGRAIGIKRFFPDKNLNEYMINYVTQKGGNDFFRSENWRKELFEIVGKYKEKNQLEERYESEEEYEKRIFYELQVSKNIIETKLDKKVKFLCWPGGAVTTTALNIASEIGYLSSTTGRDLDNIRKTLKNLPGENPSRIKRIGPGLYWNGKTGSEIKIKYKNGFLFLLTIYSYQKKKIIAPLSRIILIGVKLFYTIKLSL